MSLKGCKTILFDVSEWLQLEESEEEKEEKG
jgi:hypothetical protein